MTESGHNRWLHRFAVLTAGCTLMLIGMGGLVTSHGAGLAVPDWPTSYGYNMFLFPPSYWVGGIFYEHTHRLFASFVGLLTTVLAVWIWIKEPRRSVCWLGVGAFLTVVFQGVLGGLRVTLFKDQIGIFHAMLAQLFLVLLTVLALATSSWWRAVNEPGRALPGSNRSWNYLLASAVALVFLQLALGATMRHQHAGLAVPDFPLAYGKIWPATDATSLDLINRSRIDTRDHNPITAFHIYLHMAHRLGAALTLGTIASVAWTIRRRLGSKAGLSKLSLAWFLLICGQAGLGAMTVWSQKAADVATAHVVFGALSLVLGSLILGIVWKVQREHKAISRWAKVPAELPTSSVSSGTKALPAT